MREEGSEGGGGVHIHHELTETQVSSQPHIILPPLTISVLVKHAPPSFVARGTPNIPELQEVALRHSGSAAMVVELM